jgi:hypothetical protein
MVKVTKVTFSYPLLSFTLVTFWLVKERIGYEGVTIQFFSSDTVKTQNIKIIIWVSWPFHESITNSPVTTLVNLKQPFTGFCARAKFGFYVFFMNR